MPSKFSSLSWHDNCQFWLSLNYFFVLLILNTFLFPLYLFMTVQKREVRKEDIHTAEEGRRKVDPRCPRASNPFHQCTKQCSQWNPCADIQTNGYALGLSLSLLPIFPAISFRANKISFLTFIIINLWNEQCCYLSHFPMWLIPICKLCWKINWQSKIESTGMFKSIVSRIIIFSSLKITWVIV